MSSRKSSESSVFVAAVAGATFECSGSARVALLQLHLLGLLLASVGIVVVNVSVDCTIAVTVAVMVSVMYPLWTYAMTVVIAIDNVDVTGILII